MPTTKPSTAKKAASKAEAKTRTTVRAEVHFPAVLEALKGKKDGMTLQEMVAATKVDYRILHNVTWRLEGSPEVRDKTKIGELRKPDEKRIQRVGEGRTVRYALVPTRKPRATKAPAKAS
jgi:hypothetical protein